MSRRSWYEDGCAKCGAHQGLVFSCTRGTWLCGEHLVEWRRQLRWNGGWVCARPRYEDDRPLSRWGDDGEHLEHYQREYG